MDISKMYTMYRNLHQNSRQWGQPPRNNETFEHDDIERIRLYRNLISHSDAKEIKTPSFNKWMLDLLGVIYIRCLKFYNSTVLIQWNMLLLFPLSFNVCLNRHTVLFTYNLSRLDTQHTFSLQCLLMFPTKLFYCSPIINRVKF